MSRSDFVSVIIPCFNEEQRIAGCLDSIFANDYPNDKLEILVVDGMSEDNTRKIINKYIITHSSIIRLIDNPDRYTPIAFNLGVKNARGNIIMIMGAHSSYAKDYISQSIHFLHEYNADNVGGSMRTISRTNTLTGNTIALAISHPFGVGNSTFRTGSDEPQWVDTVFGGCYRREVFDKIGYFNENLISSQDIDFNIRLQKAGGKILLVPSIVTDYYSRSDLISFTKHNFRNGIWSILPIKYTKKPLKLRHMIPLLFTTSIFILVGLSIIRAIFLYILLILAAIYILITLYYSFKVAVVKKDFRFVISLPLAFFNLHFIYGLGSFYALYKLFKKDKISPTS
ncbi:MAG: glycosyltransferase family 2 protein [Candidatus Electryonea clarkiae]|nr:glycosyltransferase family 2 protein [Candidatus Electryonea clarkiae]MDP8285850.1 glycosyltransferase family 2 protein [Candidatus Electryonea clarkiae]